MKVFGKNPSGERLERIKRSSRYKNERFENIEPTEVLRKDASRINLIIEAFSRPKTIAPSKPVPTIKTNLNQIPGDNPAIVWFGHSSYLIKSKQFYLLADPVFSGYASPVKLFGKAFKGTDIYSIDEFPHLDVLLITHDHYDHLDYKTVLQLNSKVKRIVTSLGVGSHLEYWGIDPSKITELDWEESFSIGDDIQITATPSRHFSGRGTVRAKTLWSSFILSLHGHKLFLGGDSGYDSQFARIGREYGPFDIALLDSAQYGKDWPSIHMKPEETVQAALDLHTKVLMPVHWGKFALSRHPWNEPVKRVHTAAQKVGLKVTSPKIGKPYVLGDALETEPWWNFE